ncbi:MafI family immunity protein [Paludisphaera soli]|uniref:MafI family immunity protein n=1 Tax=Paludisphaera soli TaxID=2712865 RepID=UPI0013EADFCA|nr:MafI family immunity protein [Paludisphaera soli]
MSFEARIKNLGKAFDGRLDHGLISNAVGYSEFGENGLAVEMIADCLFDSDVRITQDEFQELLELARLTHADVERVTLLGPLAM